jgi:hypothetical protein
MMRIDFMLFGWISSLHLVLAFDFDLCDAAFISDAYKNDSRIQPRSATQKIKSWTSES